VQFDKIASVTYILCQKYINILALEMASRENEHCTNCIGTLVPYFGFVDDVLFADNWPDKGNSSRASTHSSK